MPEDEKPPKPLPEKQNNPLSHWGATTQTTNKYSFALAWKSMKHKSCFCHLYYAGACVKWGPPPPKE